MSLRQQFAAINASKVAQSLAWSFLTGFGAGLVPLLGLSATDFRAFMSNAMTPVWWLVFLCSGMAGGIGHAFGQYFPSPFDKSSSTPTTLQYPPKP